MGIDIHTYIFKRNRKENKWEQEKLFTKKENEYKEVDVYPYRSYELFDILSEKEDDKYVAFPIDEKALPEDFQEKLKNETDFCYDFREINFADLKLYLIRQPKVRDYDYEENDVNAFKDNPVKAFAERIEWYLDLAEPFWDFMPPSDIKIVYWFDH